MSSTRTNDASDARDVAWLARELARAFQAVGADARAQSGPSYQTFRDHIATQTPETLEKQIRFVSRIAEAMHQDGSVLEVGCGYGVNLVILKYLGFREVVGIEIIPAIHQNASLLLEQMSKSMDMTGCKAVLGDAENTPFQAGAFTNVLAIEVISHVPSLDRFLRETNHVLREGGLLVAVDSNNVDSPKRYRELRKLWREIRDHELRKRLEVVQREFPAVPPKLRSSIVLHTELLSLDDMRNAIPGILQSGRLPMNLYVEGHAPTFAESGLWGERGFSPPQLAKELRSYGFEATSGIYLGSARGNPLRRVEDVINRVPSRLKYMLRPTFTLRAKKVREAPALDA